MAFSTIERVFLLQGAELFRHVPMQELVVIAQLCHEVNFNQGEKFINAGDVGDCLYVIATGEVSVTVEGAGQVGMHKQGDVIGEMAIISQNPRSANCTALTEVTALKITYRDFWDLMEENSAVSLSIFKVIVTRLNETIQKLKVHSGATV